MLGQRIRAQATTLQARRLDKGRQVKWEWEQERRAVEMITLLQALRTGLQAARLENNKSNAPRTLVAVLRRQRRKKIVKSLNEGWPEQHI